MARKLIYTHTQCIEALEIVVPALIKKHPSFMRIYPVPRGGVPVAYLLSAMVTDAAPTCQISLVDSAEEATVIVDDIIDSGRTMARNLALNPNATFVALVEKAGRRDPGLQYQEGRVIAGRIADDWIVFPWEKQEENGGYREVSAEDSVIRMLQYIGENTTRGGLKETPRRVVKAWDEWFKGYTMDPKDVLKEFEDGGESYDELVTVMDIPVYSFCEHHLAPFFGVAHVAYIPNGKIVGLSKIPRLVDIFAKRLQVQERLTNQIAQALQDHLQPKGVAVVVKCRHMCMESRGIQRQGTQTVTSAMLGVMHDDATARAEFLSLIRKD